MPKPIPWPTAQATPCDLPPTIVFLITTMTLGPGEIAPRKKKVPAAKIASNAKPSMPGRHSWLNQYFRLEAIQHESSSSLLKA